MSAEVQRILRFWDYVFEEEAWHVPLLDAIRDLTAAQAAWEPAAGRHSIWQIVEHLALWKEYHAARVRGEPVGRPSEWARGRDWREIPEVSETAWQASVRRLMDAKAAYRAEIAALTDEDLDRPLPGPEGPMPLYSLRMIALGEAEHEGYHCGQICYVRALQGIPARASWD